MEENIAGYKKDNKDYSKYKADRYVSQTTDTGTGGNNTYFDTGHIKDVEEMDFSSFDSNDNKNSNVSAKDELVTIKEKIDRINNFIDDDEIKSLSGLYEQAKYQSSSTYVGYGPFMQAAQGNVGIYREQLNNKVSEITNKEFTSYEGLKTYQANLISTYWQKIRDREFLPDVSNAPDYIAIENKIAFYTEMFNDAHANYSELKGYYDQIPDSLIGSYEQAKYQSTSTYVGYGPSMQAAQGNIEIYREQLNSKVSEVAGGRYTSYESLLEDYKSAKALSERIENILDGYEKEKENYAYRYIYESEDFANYKPKYTGKMVVEDWISEDTDIAHHRVTYTFLDANGNIVPQNSELYDNLKYLYSASNLTEEEMTFIKSMLPEKLREGIELNYNYYNMYLFIRERYGDDVANQYLEDVRDEINSIQGLKEAVEFCSQLSNRGDALDDIANLLPVHFKGVGGGTINSLEGLLAWLSDNPEKTVNYYEGVWIAQFLATGNFGKIQDINYEAGQSLGNMLPSVVLTVANPYIGATYLALSSGGNTYRNLRWEGVDLDEAIFKGLLSGLSEVVTERLLGGLPFLSEVKVTNLKTWFIAAIREGNQEVLQDLINSILLGEEYTMEDAIHTWLIAALTAGEMNLPGLALGKISRSNITEKNGLLKIETENGTIEIDINELTKYIKEHPDADSNILMSELINTLEIQTFSNDVSEVTYNLNYEDYVDLCHKLSIVPESRVEFDNNSMELYKTVFKKCSNTQISQIISNSSIDEFSLLLNSINYETFKNCRDQVVERLNNLSKNIEFSDTSYVNDLTWIFANMNNSGNIAICNDLIANYDSKYMDAMTTYLLNGSLDYYETAIEFANSERAKAFQTYRTHCRDHVTQVAKMSVDSAKSIMSTLKGAGYSGNVSLYEIYVAGIWHDVGMAAGDYGINAINSQFNKKSKTFDPVELIETKDGNITRSNHTLNSALAIIDNGTYFSDFLGIDPSKLALAVFAHSKSNSGIGNLTVASDWMLGINVLDACWAKYNELYNRKTTDYVSFKDMCKSSRIIDANGNMTLSSLAELSTEAFSLRVGDANTTTVNDIVTLNQANQAINYVLSGKYGLDYNRFMDVLSNDPDGPKFAMQRLICEEFGVKYDIVTNKKGEHEIKINDDGIIKMTAGNDVVELSPFTIAFVIGENNIGFDLCDVSPTGSSDGKIHEVCTIKDGSGNMVGPIIFNINERLGEIKSGVSSSVDGTMASMDIVFPSDASPDVLQYYSLAMDKYYGNIDGIEFNYYIKDSNGNIVPFIQN